MTGREGKFLSLIPSLIHYPFSLSLPLPLFPLSPNRWTGENGRQWERGMGPFALPVRSSLYPSLNQEKWAWEREKETGIDRPERDLREAGNREGRGRAGTHFISIHSLSLPSLPSPPSRHCSDLLSIPFLGREGKWVEEAMSLSLTHFTPSSIPSSPQKWWVNRGQYERWKWPNKRMKKKCPSFSLSSSPHCEGDWETGMWTD